MTGTGPPPRPGDDGISWGTFVFSPDPAVTEIVGLAGFDLVVIDTEHTCLADAQVADLVRVAKGIGLRVLVRLRDVDPGQATRMRDAGADGVVVPHVRSRDDVDSIADAIRFPPSGRRPTCTGVRSTGYGLVALDGALIEAQDREAFLVALIEDREGIENLAALVEGGRVDAFMLGTGDLATSYGVSGQVQHPLVVAAGERFVEVVRGRGARIAAYIRHEDEIPAWREAGAELMICSIDYKVLSSAYATLLGAARAR